MRFGLLKTKLFWASLAFLLLGIVANNLSAIYIYHKYKSLPILKDLILDQLPYYKIAWLYDLLAIITVALFVYYSIKKEPNSLTYFLIVFGIIQFVRAIFVCFTPVGSPNIQDFALLNGQTFKYGMYPSGHTGSAFLTFLLSNGNYKILFLILSLSIMLTLLIARGHYSIDIFSAVIFAYAVFMFSEKYIKNKVIKN